MSENKGFSSSPDFDAGMEYYDAGDYARAIECFKRGAAAGDADCQYYIGVCYHNGNGVKKDLFEAAAWYRKAAAQGHAGAKAGLNSFLNF